MRHLATRKTKGTAFSAQGGPRRRAACWRDEIERPAQRIGAQREGIGAAENLNPLEGLDEPLRPLNMVEEGDAEEAEPPDAAADSELEPQAPVDEETNARFRAVLASAADRWARRISRSGAIDEKEICLIAEALAVPVADAERWAQEQDGRDLSEPDLRQSLIQLGLNS
jgi:hypothetical protein